NQGQPCDICWESGRDGSGHDTSEREATDIEMNSAEQPCRIGNHIEVGLRLNVFRHVVRCAIPWEVDRHDGEVSSQLGNVSNPMVVRSDSAVDQQQRRAMAFTNVSKNCLRHEAVVSCFRLMSTAS